MKEEQMGGVPESDGVSMICGLVGTTYGRSTIQYWGMSKR